MPRRGVHARPEDTSHDTDLDADVLVAGGGVAGLTAAHALAGLGLRVQVLERSQRLGGRAASWPDATTGDVVDIGPHVVSTEHVNFLEVLRRLGTADRVCWQPDPLITLLDRGRHLDIRSWRLPTPLQGLPNLPASLRSVGWTDLLSNAGVALRAARLDEAGTLALDGLDALSLLRRHRVTQRFIDWFWAPTCLALLNVPLARCSAAALMRVFRLMLGRSGYHFGFPRCGLSQLHAEPCAAAVESRGGRVRREAPVERVLLREGRACGLRLADGRELRARAVLLALPPDALAALGLPWGPPALQRYEPSPYLSTVLWFDRRIGRARFWARVWTPRDLNMDFYDLANIRGLPRAAGSIVASNAIHAVEAWHDSDERLIERTRREVIEFAPAAREARLRHARVHRIPMAIPCPLPGTESLRPGNATPIPGLWLAGDWTATALPASMESAARSALLAAEQLARFFALRPRRLAQQAPETTGAIALLRRPWPGPATPRRQWR